MDSINGPESHHSYKGNLPNNVNKDGMSGLIPQLKRPNGQEPKIKNYCNQQEYFQVNGELSRRLQAEHQHNVMKGMKNYLTWLKENPLNKQKI